MHRRELRFIWMKILRIWLHFMANSDLVLYFSWKLIGILCESKFCITYYVHPNALASNLRGENLFPLGGISFGLNEFLPLFFHLSLFLLLGLFFSLVLCDTGVFPVPGWKTFSSSNLQSFGTDSHSSVYLNTHNFPYITWK